MTPDRSKAARDLLAFYAEAGVDAPLGEAPLDRLAEVIPTHSGGSVTSPLAGEVAARSAAGGGSTSAQARASRTPPTPTLPHKGGGSNNGGPPPPPDEALMAARAAAKSAATLEELREILDRFEGCALRATAKQLVFADGNPQSRVMFVGEAPGRDEDIEGLPFVGVSGKLLDRMLAAIGLDRRSVYIANIVPWRPPGNRTPTPQEAAICLPFTLRQIELVNPDVLVCLGGPSAQTLLRFKEGIRKMRGRWFPFHTGTREIRALATFHPAYLLRTPLEKRFAWRDFLAIKKALET
jgi:uracil-DNA glycosylase